MTQTYYHLWYRLDNADGYLIWFSDDVDGAIIQADGTVPSFGNQDALRAYASMHQITLDEMEPLLHDLDVVAQWLRRSFSAEVDCDAFLTAWNLFADLALSVNRNFDSDYKRSKQVYEKLFWGNNLPVVAPTGKHYIPLWSDDEVLLMREVLTNGLRLFRKHVVEQ